MIDNAGLREKIKLGHSYFQTRPLGRRRAKAGHLMKEAAGQGGLFGRMGLSGERPPDLVPGSAL